MDKEDLENIKLGNLIAKEEPIKEDLEAGYAETPTHYFRICARSGRAQDGMNQRYIHFSRKRNKINPEIYEVTIGSTEDPDWFNQPTFDTKEQAQEFIENISNANTSRNLGTFVFNIRSSLPRSDSNIGNNEDLSDSSKRHLVLTTCGPAYIHEYSKNYDPNYDIDKAFKDIKVLVKSNPDVFLESKDSDNIEEIENFIEDIYDLRKTSIANEGEYSLGNLVFKEMRNRGYLDNLKDLKNKIKTKELSLPESLGTGLALKKFDDLSKEELEELIGIIQDVYGEYMDGNNELEDLFFDCSFEYDGVSILDIFTDETCLQEFSLEDAIEYYGKENIESYINKFIEAFKDSFINISNFEPYINDDKVSGEDAILENNTKYLSTEKSVCNESKIAKNEEKYTEANFKEFVEVLNGLLTGNSTVTDIKYAGLDNNGNPYCDAFIDTVVEADDCEEDDFYDDEGNFGSFKETCRSIDSYLSDLGGLYSAEDYEDFELKHDFSVKLYDSETIDNDIDVIGKYSPAVLYPVDSAHDAVYPKIEGFITIGTPITITMLLNKEN